MGEAVAIDRVEDPVTIDSLVEDLRELGVSTGDDVLVHASLSAVGWVCGGAPAVIDALQAVVTETGTVMMPTHTGQYSDPSDWEDPPVPDDWVDQIRETMPPFRPEVTPSRGMGVIPETFRCYPGVRRSGHPVVSFAAWGADAPAFVEDHPYDYGLGEGSPVARLYDHGGAVLLLGVGHDANSSLHLGEYRADLGQEPVVTGAPVLVDGKREYVEYEEIQTSTDDFSELGTAYEEVVEPRIGTVGAATAKLFDQPSLVDFAVDWLESNRRPA